MNRSDCDGLGQASKGLTFLPISQAAAAVGPAAKTLAALYVLADGPTRCLFHRVEKIAQVARLPTPTVRSHLRKLAEYGWIENLGRQGLRTCTWRLSEKAALSKAPYGPMPVNDAERALSWSCRVVLAMAVRRLWAMKGRTIRPRDCLSDLTVLCRCCHAKFHDVFPVPPAGEEVQQ